MLVSLQESCLEEKSMMWCPTIEFKISRGLLYINLLSCFYKLYLYRIIGANAI